MEGWIKLHRSIWDNPIVTKDNDHLAVWIWLLTHCVWDKTDVMFRGKRVTLKPGQLTTGRQIIADDLRINRSKVDRILKTFEIEHQIEQQTSNKCRLISILSWDLYQNSEHQNEQQVSNNRATSEQQVSTNKEYKNIKKVKNPISILLGRSEDDWLNTEVGYDL